MNLAHDLATLPDLSVAQLRNRYAEIFGEPTNAGHKGWLVKRIAWRLQADCVPDGVRDIGAGLRPAKCRLTAATALQGLADRRRGR